MKKFVVFKEACEVAHVSRWTMYRWVTSGLVHAVRLGKNKSSPIYIDAVSLQTFMRGLK